MMALLEEKKFRWKYIEKTWRAEKSMINTTYQCSKGHMNACSSEQIVS